MINDEQKVMKIIGDLAEFNIDVPREEIEIEAKKENIEDVSSIIEKLIEQGLIMDQTGNKINLIAKRLSW